MTLTIYTRSGCKYCNEAKIIMIEKGISFEEIYLANQEAIDDFKANHPDLNTLPQIFYPDGELLGGCNDLKQITSYIDKLLQELSKRIVPIIFKKVNGDIREMLCTTNEKIIASFLNQDTEDHISKKPYEYPFDFITVFDVEEQGFRRFKYRNLIQYTEAATNFSSFKL